MKAKGFTLIELLITLVILGIIAAIAYPSYESSVRRSRRADAHAAIAALQQAQQKLRASCRFYAQQLDTAANSCGASAGATKVLGSTSSPEGFYALSIQAGSATGNAFTLEADPLGAQAKDTDCDPIVLTVDTANPNGLKTPTECW